MRATSRWRALPRVQCALEGTEEVMAYTGVPSWDGFKPGWRPHDVEA